MASGIDVRKPAPPAIGEPQQALAAAIEAAGSARAFAAAAGLSEQYVSDVRMGRRAYGPTILAALGLARVVTYVPAPIDGGAL